MPFQLLGNKNNVLSPYKDGFLLFYLYTSGRGEIRQDIGTHTPFSTEITQSPFKGKFTDTQLRTLEEYKNNLVIDSNNRVWRRVSDRIVAPPVGYYLNKRIHEGQSNQRWGVQAELKTTNVNDYTGNDYLGSVKYLRERGIL